jgi:signal transduction histidine kinase
MYRSARIRLTAWYLLIIMCVSIFFSVLIFHFMSRELEQEFHRAELRHQAMDFGLQLPRRFSMQSEDLHERLRNIAPKYLTQDDLQIVRKSVIQRLFIINILILFASAALGYFLAGKTLRPIEQTLEEQKRFISDASHELKTPLTALQTSIEVALRDKKLNILGAKEVLRENLSDVDKLKKLTNDLLSLSRYQQKNGNFIKERFDISEAVDDVLKIISPIAQKKDIEINSNYRSFSINSHKESLEKLLIILLDNAVKYTPTNGAIWLTVKVNKKSVKIVVRDSGKGISKEDLPHIFDRFYRTDESRSKNQEAGYGLGLSIAKEIIDLHKGTIHVDSKVGKGSTFVVSLPQ